MRMLATLLLAATAATSAAPVFPQSFPAKPLRMLVGYSAGGGADALARIVAARMSTGLGQQVLIDNRPGAGGTIAADTLAKALPDGHAIKDSGAKVE